MVGKKSVLGIFAIGLLLLLTVFSASSIKAWVYQDGIPEDTKFEEFGPRADQLLIRLYANNTAEWDALARGEIDITDWPLSKAHYDLFTSNAINSDTGLPYNETLNVVVYGEDSLYILDINNNNNQFLGNPPDPAYPNPIYPNPGSVKEFRQAIAHLADRSQLDTIIGKGFYVPLYTPVPPSMGTYSHPEIRPGGALEDLTYPYSRAAAEALLDTNGFPVNAPTGWRYWDRNHDNVEDPDEYLELKFFIRHDDAKRLAFGTFVADELSAVKVRVKRFYYIASDPIILNQVFLYQNFHLFTGSWSLGVDPDHLILWNWDYYWHPGKPYNYAGVNNPDFNRYSYGVQYATTLDQAKTNAWLAQEVFASEALSVPLWSNAGSKAISRIYTGGNKWTPTTPNDGENAYRGKYWEGAVNRPAHGLDDFYSFLNMRPADYKRGDGENMTIRWGFKVSEIERLNPVYSEWVWDWNILSLIYESLLVRNPYNLAEFIPWLAENFEVGTYNHPVYGECSKVKLVMRADATWHDGTPITTADVYFTWVELRRILESRGLPDPIWCPWQQPMIDFKIHDPYNFEMLFDYKGVWVLGWLSSAIIMPKHIWKPIAESAPLDVLTGFAPDPNMVGSGPWRFVEYVGNSHVLLVANRPGSTVQTNLPDSMPITSPKGYWKYHPVKAEVRMDGTTKARIDYYTQPHTISYTLHNLYLGGSITLDVSLTHPDGSTHGETGVVIAAGGDWSHSWTGEIKGVKTTSINVIIIAPAEFAGIYGWSHVYYGTIEYSLWGRPPQDIVGSTLYDDIGYPDYPYKGQLQSPDIKVDMKDVAIVAKAFGSYPDHKRWNPYADVNNDYKVDLKDIGLICVGFGRVG